MQISPYFSKDENLDVIERVPRTLRQGFVFKVEHQSRNGELFVDFTVNPGYMPQAGYG